MANITIDERRSFSRIPFHAQAHIHADKGEWHLNCEVLDVSLNGILIVKPDGWRGRSISNRSATRKCTTCY